MVKLITSPIKFLFTTIVLLILFNSGFLVSCLAYAWIAAVAISPLMLVGNIIIRQRNFYSIKSFNVIFWTVMTGFFITKYCL